MCLSATPYLLTVYKAESILFLNKTAHSKHVLSELWARPSDCVRFCLGEWPFG